MVFYSLGIVDGWDLACLDCVWELVRVGIRNWSSRAWR